MGWRCIQINVALCGLARPSAIQMDGKRISLPEVDLAG